MPDFWSTQIGIKKAAYDLSMIFYALPEKHQTFKSYIDDVWNENIVVVQQFLFEFITELRDCMGQLVLNSLYKIMNEIFNLVLDIACVILFWLSSIEKAVIEYMNLSRQPFLRNLSFAQEDYNNILSKASDYETQFNIDHNSLLSAAIVFAASLVELGQGVFHNISSLAITLTKLMQQGIYSLKNLLNPVVELLYALNGLLLLSPSLYYLFRSIASDSYNQIHIYDNDLILRKDVKAYVDSQSKPDGQWVRAKVKFGQLDRNDINAYVLDCIAGAILIGQQPPVVSFCYREMVTIHEGIFSRKEATIIGYNEAKGEYYLNNHRTLFNMTEIKIALLVANYLYGVHQRSSTQGDVTIQEDVKRLIIKFYIWNRDRHDSETVFEDRSLNGLDQPGMKNAVMEYMDRYLPLDQLLNDKKLPLVDATGVESVRPYML